MRDSPFLIFCYGVAAVAVHALQPEIRPADSGDLFGLRLPPGGDRGVMAGEQHIRHARPAPLGRAGIMRIFQQPGAEAFLLGARPGAHHARQQPHAGIEQHERRQLPAGEHVIADADLLDAADIEHPLVDALVPSADQPHPRPRCQRANPRLVEARRPAARDRAAAARHRRRSPHPARPAASPCRRRRRTGCRRPSDAGRSRPRGCRARRAAKAPDSSARPASDCPSGPGNIAGNSVNTVACQLMPKRPARPSPLPLAGEGWVRVALPRGHPHPGPLPEGEGARSRRGG